MCYDDIIEYGNTSFKTLANTIIELHLPIKKQVKLQKIKWYKYKYNFKYQPLTSHKLNKLAYMCHGLSLAIYDMPILLDDEVIAAYKYGPVCQNLRNRCITEYKLHKDIRKYIPYEIIYKDLDYHIRFSTLKGNTNSYAVVNATIDAYKKFTIGQICTLCNSPDYMGQVWIDARKDNDYKEFVVMNDDSIKECFKNYLKKFSNNEEKI